MKQSDNSFSASKSQEEKLDQFLKNLRVVDVELFITAARFKSLGKSASFYHLSQSAASTAIRRVEDAFGLTLCTHEKRQFALTRDGQILLPRLERWIKDLKDLVVSKDETPLRLATTHAIAQVALPTFLSTSKLDFRQMRPDQAYAEVLQDQADLALVLDNAPWNGVFATEIGAGHFQLYCKDPAVPLQPILLPEDQMEVLALQLSWKQTHGYRLPIKSRIPSWSLIAQICSTSPEVGFLPEFLAQKLGLHPVSWQPPPSPYRVLAIHKKISKALEPRFERILRELSKVF